MKGMPFHLQEKGVLKVVAEVSVPISNCKKKCRCSSNEPTSVLDTRRSPSPPTSTSTLSSSLGGGSGCTDTAGMAAVSDNPLHKWPPYQDSSSAAAAESEGGDSSSSGGSRKEEWASDLQPIPSSLEIGYGGGEKCGLGMEEWDNMLSESSNEKSFFRWFVGDMDDPSLKQLLQSGVSAEFENGGAGLGVVDPGFGFEHVSAPVNAFNNLAGADFSFLDSNSNTNRMLSIQNPTPLSNFKIPCLGSSNNSNSPNPTFSHSAINLSTPFPLPASILCNQPQQQLDPLDEKPQLFNPQLLLNQRQTHPPPQNSAFFLPLSYVQQDHHHLLTPEPKRHHPTIVDPCFHLKTQFSDSGQELLLRRQQQQQQQSLPNLHLLPHHLQSRPTIPKGMGAGEDSNLQQALVDQLFKAAELVENGNSIHARAILARLNHHLSPVGKPIHRAAFYFKEALQLLLENFSTPHSPYGGNHLTSSASPLDVVFKISAYKVFSEVSPLIQFVSFTSNHILLEALDGFNRIHIIDFDIGLGGQWAVFMQELASRFSGAPLLKITAFASPSSHDPLELVLTRENLCHFANELGIHLEFNLLNIDSLDLSSTPSLLSENEVVAVNLPVGPSTPPLPSLLRLVKQLTPKIVVSVDCGCDRSELSFSHHFLNALQSYSNLLNSLDAVTVDSDAVQKIERFMLQPRIENIVLGQHRAAADKLPPWRTLFASAGLSPLPLSNFTEAQAECLLKRLQVRGFHVEKRQASLYLYWQRGELASVSAWRC